MRSTWPRSPGVTEIFSEYVRQRRDGRSQQEVVGFLKPMLAQLRQDARQQLVALLRSWEAREGYRYSASPASPEGSARADDDFAWLRELEEQEADRPATPAPPGSPSPLMATSKLPDARYPVPGNSSAAPPLDVNVPVHPSVQQPEQRVPLPSEETVYCPACGRANHVSAIECYACGHTTRTPDAPVTAAPQGDSVSFGRSSVLVLCVRGHDQPIVVDLHAKPELLIGRSAAQTSLIPDIDLAPFGAADQGVSRQHARLRYQDSTITITDLGSVNHTYVNDQRLHAHEVHILQDGDTLHLGRLQVRVRFQPATGHITC